MKAKYLSMAALALMGALASCQSDDFTVARPDNAVSVNFSVGSLKAATRSNAIATDDTQRQFNQGDQISVSTNDQEAVLFQCTSTEDQTWTEAVPNKFLLWTQPMLTFSAYYPVTTGTSMTAFTLPADQSSEAKIALADYMTRQQVISRPDGGSDISLQLERKMARVIVRISGFGNQYFDDQKTVKNVRIYSEASGIADGNPTGSSTEIQPYAQGSYDDWSEGWRQNSTFTALVVPGSGDSGANFIRLTDGEYNTLLVKGIPELEAGNSYTFNLVVGKNREQGAAARTLAEVTAEDLGKIVGADGKIYATKAAAEAVATGNAVAMIAYVGSSTEHATYKHGLAIALADESDSNWSTANSTCEGKSAVTNTAWLLPSRNQWNAMFNANGGNEESYTGLNSELATAGGDSSKLKEQGGYWTSSENGGNYVWRVRLISDIGLTSWGTDYNISTYHVRACLAF